MCSNTRPHVNTTSIDAFGRSLEDSKSGQLSKRVAKRENPKKGGKNDGNKDGNGPNRGCPNCPILREEFKQIRAQLEKLNGKLAAVLENNKELNGKLVAALEKIIQLQGEIIQLQKQPTSSIR